MAKTMSDELNITIDKIECGRIDRGPREASLSAVHCYLEAATQDLECWQNVSGGWEFVDGDKTDRPLGGYFQNVI